MVRERMPSMSKALLIQQMIHLVVEMTSRNTPAIHRRMGVQRTGDFSTRQQRR
jgi:hypothetical protein